MTSLVARSELPVFPTQCIPGFCYRFGSVAEPGAIALSFPSSAEGRVMYAFIHFADNLSAWFGKAFGWLIMLMTFGVSYEVFVRYVLNAPTPWALDVSFIMYGTLFMMGGAYTLGKNGHVRGDFLYRNWKPSTQARVDLILYFVFFFPGVLALSLSQVSSTQLDLSAMGKSVSTVQLVFRFSSSKPSWCLPECW